MRLSFQIVALFCLQLAGTAQTVPLRFLHGHVPPAVERLQAIDRVPATNRLNLAIGLPLRNTNGLASLLQQIYDPASPRYRHYLTPDQFIASFGPTATDYAAVAAFAKAEGLEVVGTHPNRLLLDVAGPAANVEKAFHVNLRLYQHPTEKRTFFAPDAEPSVPTNLPILYIAGLNNYVLPRRNLKPKPAGKTVPQNGSAPGGNLMGNDFRNAYVPGTSLTGAGQSVGLLQFDSGFYQNDITAYETLAGLPNVPVTPVLLDGYNGRAGDGNDEVSLDIEMVMSMAPGVSHIYVYEGTTVDDILNRMAADTSVKQFSASWSYSIDSTTEQIYQEFAAQGQSFFNASGDGDAWVGEIYSPCDDPYITIVGGTTLTMSGTGSAYGAETVWNEGFDPPGWVSGDNYWGSGGGISTVYTIPSWQKNVSMAANQGSTTMRNIPDVAMNANNVWAIYGNGSSASFVGTSCAAPLWAGFAALVNQQATTNGDAPAGFLNPALYQIGLGTSYSATFHDTTTGNNAWPGSMGLFNAAAGYDLCTGWGSPTGTNLINALAQLVVTKQGLAFTTNADNTLTVSGCYGTPSDVTIPATTNGLTVTGIGAYAFVDEGLTNVTIPSTVTEISDEAFGYCSNLVSAYFLGNAPRLGVSPFIDDTNLTIYYLPGTSGWSSPFAGVLAVMLNPPGSAGSMDVTISPAGAVSAGAQWQVDGGVLQPAGATVLGLAAGSHVVTFTTVSGWTTPSSQTISVSANSTATAAGTYVALPASGSLEVVLSPAGAVNAGAQWQVDANGTWENSGVTVANLSAGSHTVSFSAVSGWITPASQTISVNANGIATAIGAYVAIPPTGSLEVSISPAAAVSAGAQWQVDGTNELSGATVSNLPVGTHTVSFTDVSGWTTPFSQTISVSANVTTLAYGAYIAIPTTGLLQVILTPENAVAAGAMWRVDGGSLQGSGAMVGGLSPGNHAISFAPAPGWSPPPNQAVTISVGLTTRAFALYTVSGNSGNWPEFVTNGFGTVQHGVWPANLVVGKTYGVTAAPKAGNIFQDWTDGSASQVVLSSNAHYTFVCKPNLVLEANFATNVFLAAKGAYQGLFGPTNNPRQQTDSGAFGFNLTASGAFSGNLRIGAQTVALTGKFGMDGAAVVASKREGQSSLTTTLQLDLTNQSVSGTVTDGNFVAQLSGYESVFSARNPATGYQGRYTLIIPGTNNPAEGPYGTGYGTVTVSASGTITFLGSLADGTAVSQSSVISEDGYWPLYLSLYGGKGSWWSWNYFTNGALSSVPYASWINATNSSKTADYRLGFTNEAASIIGTNYLTTGPSLSDLQSGEIVLTGGGLPSAITNEIVAAPEDKFALISTSAETNKLNLLINKATGVVSGSCRNPSNAKQTIKLNGVWLQGQGIVTGYFLGTNQSGIFTLTGQ